MHVAFGGDLHDLSNTENRYTMISTLERSLHTLCVPMAGESGILRRISPLPKVLFCLLFSGLALSVNRYDVGGATLFAWVPLGLAWVGRVPLGGLLKRCCVPLPLILCTGLANCFFDPSGGTAVLAVLVMKTLTTVGMALLLAATTSMSEIAGALSRLRVPNILVLQIQLMFRYLSLLLEETRNVTNAYFLRNPDCRTIPLCDWGAIVGRLFLRTMERGDAIYHAMQCRLFHMENALPLSGRGTRREWCGTIAGLLFFLLLRCVR